MAGLRGEAGCITLDKRSYRSGCVRMLQGSCHEFAVSTSLLKAPERKLTLL